MSALEVKDLCVEILGEGAAIVEDISFALEPGEIVGLVGESGSGKTTVGLAMLGHAQPGARIASGSVRIGDKDVTTLSDRERRDLRGNVVAYIPQDPASALNPARRIGVQILEMLRYHRAGAEEGAAERLETVLAEVKLPSDPDFLRRYPHQLSGGQQQRAAIAMAFACRPGIIVLDEPTTGLDVTTQAHILETVRQLCTAHSVAALYVTHDLAVVSELADRIMVLYAGGMVELGSARDLFAAPAHPYARGLIRAMPRLSGSRVLKAIAGNVPAPGERPNGCRFAPRCDLCVEECTRRQPELRSVATGHQVRCIRAEELIAQPAGLNGTASDPDRAGRGGVALSIRGVEAAYGSQAVLHGVSFDVHQGECVALVGESGSGKTTLARTVIGLHAPYAGEVVLFDEPQAGLARERAAESRRLIQYVFQNPYASLNPRKRIGDILAGPLQHFMRIGKRDAGQRVTAALERVSLPASVRSRYPDQLSGGERQRVAIARALVCEPRILICDEVTSALDVSVQAAIIELLQRLQRESELSLLFVTHDLALVRSLADRILVLNSGSIVEEGDVSQVLERPSEDYTRVLLANTPGRLG